jgi:AAA family ATP:ADP antiporter
MVERLVLALWGKLKGDEARKFFYLSVGAFFLVGAQWPIRVLRDSLLINTIGSAMQPNAKILALLLCLPLTLFYTALVGWLPREKVLYFIVGVLTTIGVGFSVVLYLWSNGVIVSPSMLGWGFYIFAETFDALTVAPYWAFINDITYPGEAKRGYGMIVFASQFGGFVFTGFGRILSSNGSNYRDRLPIIALIATILLPLFAIFIWKTMHAVRRQNLVGYLTLDETKGREDKCVKTGFLNGIRLLLSQPYVAGIFALTAFREIVSTLMSYRLYRAVELGFVEQVARQTFLFDYALAMQLIAAFFALFGTSFFQRRFGIRFTLMVYPIFMVFCAVVTTFSNMLCLVAAAVATAKALHYTFNKPSREVLYIPTSVDVKYKSKAWIEVFGARSAKMSGAALNKVVGSLPSVVGGIVIAMTGIWIFVAGDRSLGN